MNDRNCWMVKTFQTVIGKFVGKEFVFDHQMLV